MKCKHIETVSVKEFFFGGGNIFVKSVCAKCGCEFHNQIDLKHMEILIDSVGGCRISSFGELILPIEYDGEKIHYKA